MRYRNGDDDDYAQEVYHYRLFFFFFFFFFSFFYLILCVLYVVFHYLIIPLGYFPVECFSLLLWGKLATAESHYFSPSLTVLSSA